MLGAPAYTSAGSGFFDSVHAGQQTIPENLADLRHAARQPEMPPTLAGGPDVTASRDSDLVAAGSPISLSARIDDTRFMQANGTESDQNIVAAAAYLDGLPWEGALSVATLAASDGAFDSKAENVQGAIASNGLSSGKHLLFVQGTDASGQAGSPNAVFIDVAPANEIASLSGTISARQGGAPLATTIQVSNPLTGESRSAISDAGNGGYLRSMHAGTVDIHVDAPPG